MTRLLSHAVPAGGGSSPKSPTAASMESYTLEGTKKQGVSLKTKKKLLVGAGQQAMG